MRTSSPMERQASLTRKRLRVDVKNIKWEILEEGFGHGQDRGAGCGTQPQRGVQKETAEAKGGYARLEAVVKVKLSGRVDQGHEKSCARSQQRFFFFFFS